MYMVWKFGNLSFLSERRADEEKGVAKYRDWLEGEFREKLGGRKERSWDGRIERSLRKVKRKVKTKSREVRRRTESS